MDESSLDLKISVKLAQSSNGCWVKCYNKKKGAVAQSILLHMLNSENE